MRSERSRESLDEKVFRVREWQKSLDRTCKKVGTDRVTHHDLRHLFATRCIESGVDVPTVSRWLGHKDGGALAVMVVQCSMRRLSKETWEQIKTAYASGIGLREIARNMNIPAGTMPARAKREGWTQQIQQAKAIAFSEVQSNAIGPMQSIAAVMQERGERHRERMAGMSERVVDHLETMHPNEILSPSSQVEKIDTVARRTFGLDSPTAGSGSVNLNVLSGGRAIVQVNQKNE